MLFFETILAGYLIGRAVVPLRLHPGWKIALSLLVLAIGFKFHLLHLFGGPMYFAPMLPRAILLTAAGLFAALFLFFFLLVAADLIRLVIALLRRIYHLPCRADTQKINNRINLSLLIVSVLFSGIGLYEGTRLPRVRELSITLPDLPGEADGMTIAVLADLHADGITRAPRIQAIVDRVNALQPDLITIVGDFVDGTVETRGEELLPLAGLRAPLGVFGVVGNHEYYSGYPDWRDFLPTLGIRLLLNEQETLCNGNLRIAGVTDPAAVRFQQEPPDIMRTLGDNRNSPCTILLAHQPRLAKEAAEAGVSLQLSGHTHGGMVPGLASLVASANGGFVSGVYRLGKTQLLVTNGSGIWNGFPIRLGIPSEIILLRLRR